MQTKGVSAEEYAEWIRRTFARVRLRTSEKQRKAAAVLNTLFGGGGGGKRQRRTSTSSMNGKMAAAASKASAAAPAPASANATITAALTASAAVAPPGSSPTGRYRPAGGSGGSGAGGSGGSGGSGGGSAWFEEDENESDLWDWVEDSELLEQLESLARDKDEKESVELRSSLWMTTFRQAHIRERQAFEDLMADSPSIFARLRKSREELAEAERSRRASEEAVAAAAAKAAEEEEAAMQAALGEQLETGDASLRASRPGSGRGEDFPGGDDADAVGGDEGIPAPAPEAAAPEAAAPEAAAPAPAPAPELFPLAAPTEEAVEAPAEEQNAVVAAMVQASHEEEDDERLPEQILDDFAKPREVGAQARPRPIGSAERAWRSCGRWRRAWVCGVPRVAACQRGLARAVWRTRRCGSLRGSERKRPYSHGGSRMRGRRRRRRRRGVGGFIEWGPPPPLPPPLDVPPSMVSPPALVVPPPPPPPPPLPPPLAANRLREMQPTSDEEAERIFRYWLAHRTSVHVSLNFNTGKDGKRTTVFHLAPANGVKLQQQQPVADEQTPLPQQQQPQQLQQPSDSSRPAEGEGGALEAAAGQAPVHATQADEPADADEPWQFARAASSPPPAPRCAGAGGGHTALCGQQSVAFDASIAALRANASAEARAQLARLLEATPIYDYGGLCPSSAVDPSQALPDGHGGGEMRGGLAVVGARGKRNDSGLLNGSGGEPDAGLGICSGSGWGPADDPAAPVAAPASAASSAPVGVNLATAPPCGGVTCSAEFIDALFEAGDATKSAISPCRGGGSLSARGWAGGAVAALVATVAHQLAGGLPWAAA